MKYLINVLYVRICSDAVYDDMPDEGFTITTQSLCSPYSINAVYNELILMNFLRNHVLKWCTVDEVFDNDSKWLCPC